MRAINFTLTQKVCHGYASAARQKETEHFHNRKIFYSINHRSVRINNSHTSNNLMFYVDNDYYNISIHCVRCRYTRRSIHEVG